MTQRFKKTCPECAQPFVTTRADQTFCTPVHKAAFNNRNSARGRAGLTQAVLAWRAARNRADDGDVGKAAFGELCRIADEMLREDKKAGRDPVAYIKRRYTVECKMPVRLSTPKAAQTNPRRPAARRANPVVAGRGPAAPITLNQRVAGSNPASPTIVLPEKSEKSPTGPEPKNGT
jgi:hypothetical protein